MKTENQKIIRCTQCDYRGISSINREKCRYCGGKLEVIAREINSKKEDGNDNPI